MRIKSIFRLVIFVVIISLMLIIILSNASSVRVNLIFFSFDCPSIVLILASLFIGYLIGVLSSTFISRSKHKDRESYAKNIGQSEKETNKKNKK